MKQKAYAKLIQPSTDSRTNHHKGIEHASLSVGGSIKHLGTFLTLCTTEVMSMLTFCGLVRKNLGGAARLPICISRSTNPPSKLPLVRQGNHYCRLSDRSRTFSSNALQLQSMLLSRRSSLLCLSYLIPRTKQSLRAK